jgi:hypothetical protein
MKAIFIVSGILAALAITFKVQAQLKVGDQFSGWKDGILDIHHINTGKGECAFFMFPDGTTMLVDAGATQQAKPRVTDPKPDGSREPGEWIARYILHFLEGQPVKKLDYVFLTHFHDDHIGETYPDSKMSGNGAYQLSGITEVAEFLPIGKLIDRGWPGYDWPKPQNAGYIQNYIQFVKWSTEKNGVVAEQFKVGDNRQFLLLRNPEKYPDFEIRNVAANGQVWTGVANTVRNHFPALESLPPNQYPGENMCSSAFRLSYGKFDYFNGGDITTGVPGSWQDIETPVGLVTGPVEICLANHHAYFDAMGVLFLQAVRPLVHIIQVWSPSQPDNGVLARMMSTWTYPGSRDVFATNIMEETRVVSGRIDNLKSQQGHIVVRVDPGGESFLIYILDDSEENFRIKSIHGPYNCN